MVYPVSRLSKFGLSVHAACTEDGQGTTSLYRGLETTLLSSRGLGWVISETTICQRTDGNDYLSQEATLLTATNRGRGQ